MNKGKNSIVPFLIAAAAIVVLVIGLRAMLDMEDQNTGGYDSVSETQVEAVSAESEEMPAVEASAESEEAVSSVEEQTTDEISSEEVSSEDVSYADGAGAAEAESVSEAEPVSEEASKEEPSQTAGLKFRSKKLLNDHYNKHGIDMGFGSAKEYEAAAAAVVANPSALHKTEKEDGDDVYYVEATNEFVVVSTDGYIRTYFCPDSGIKYYNKQ